MRHYLSGHPTNVLQGSATNYLVSGSQLTDKRYSNLKEVTLPLKTNNLRFTLLTMTKDDDDFQLYPCFNGLPSESLDDYTFEVEALVAGSKDDEKKLIGPRLVRRLGGVPGALARKELHMPDLAKPEGHKLSLLSLEQKGIQERCSGQATSCKSPV